MTLFVLSECLICDLVHRAVQALVSKYGLVLDVRQADDCIPAVPALYYQNILYIGEGIPYQLSLALKGDK